MPLNMNQVKSSNTKTERKLLDAGSHMARVVQVVDMGLQPQNPYQGKEKPPAYKLYITFEFPQSRIDIEGESRPMWKSKTINLSSHEKSRCFQWYKKLDPSNKHKGDWSKLINTECLVLIVHNEGRGKSEGKVFDDIADISPPMAGLTIPPLENDTVVFDLMSPDKEIFDNFPDWMKEQIQSNLEYDGSKLQNLVEGNPIKFTARAPGDAEEMVDSTDISPDEILTAPVGDVDLDETWD